MSVFSYAEANLYNSLYHTYPYPVIDNSDCLDLFQAFQVLTNILLKGSYVSSCEEQFLRADLTTLMWTTINFQRVSTLLRVDPVTPVPFGFTIETAYDEFTWRSSKVAGFCWTRETLILKAELRISKE